MDQDSFRQLLSKSSTPTVSSSARPASSLKGTKKAKSGGVDAAFKPRKLTKLEGKYRDRAAERRIGNDGDYAEVESILEDLEQRASKATSADEPRNDEEDDDSLEQAFQHQPAKRTREDIVRELKEKRAKTDGDATMEDTNTTTTTTEPVALKQTGKFKPIGFQPIGGDKTKKRKVKDGEEKKKKKKRKTEPTIESKPTDMPPPPPPAQPAKRPEPEPDEDVDIFAGVGEYEGLDLDEDAEDEERSAPQPVLAEGRPSWFGADDPDLAQREPTPPPRPPTPPPVQEEEEKVEEQPEEEQEEQQMRLQPLHSSAIPSIKDLLAMDDEAGGSRKRKKSKKGKGNNAGEAEGSKPKKSSDAKIDRDYQRLKSYTEKRGDT